MSASNFIGGQRSAAGSVHLQSLDARTGEALPGVFTQATPGEVAAAAEAAEQAERDERRRLRICRNRGIDETECPTLSELTGDVAPPAAG